MAAPVGCGGQYHPRQHADRLVVGQTLLPDEGLPGCHGRRVDQGGPKYMASAPARFPRLEQHARHRT